MFGGEGLSDRSKDPMSAPLGFASPKMSRWGLSQLHPFSSLHRAGMGPLKAALRPGFSRSGWDLGGVSRGAPAPARVGSAEGRPQGLLAGGDGACGPAAVPQFPPLGKRRQRAATLRGRSSWPGGLGGSSGAPLGMGGRRVFFFWGVPCELWGEGCV